MAWLLWNIRDTSRRANWDKTFDQFVLVESNIQGNEIVYNRIPAPWPVTNRDFLQWRRILINHGKPFSCFSRRMPFTPNAFHARVDPFVFKFFPSLCLEYPLLKTTWTTFL